MSKPAIANPLARIFRSVANTVAIVVGIVILLILFWAGPLILNKGAVSYANIDEHFRYASIGGEDSDGIPYWIWKALPAVFSDHLSGEGLTSFGFIQEPDHELPIGFSKSSNRLGLAVVTQNCATCHAGQVRETPDSAPQIISTMPSNTVDLQGYIQFLANVGADSRFNAKNILPYIKELGADLNPLEYAIYRFIAIPETRDALIRLRDGFQFMDRQTAYGPGRVDTFSSYKTRRFGFISEQLPEEELRGIADFPSIWNQKPRVGMDLHWDGNNNSIDERNKSASLALVQPTTINFDSVYRIRDWLLNVPAPQYPYAVNQTLAEQGKPLFDQNCASCHALNPDPAYGPKRVGTVVPIEEIGTDRGRLDSYTYEFASNQYTLFSGISYQGKDQRFKHFRKTDGYSNMLLDGIWLRAPYLHNGSVPTLRDLLEKPENRPTAFYRGNDLFDQENVGFVSDVASSGDSKHFKYETTSPGNSNSGHLYGTELSATDKNALLEYLKTL